MHDSQRDSLRDLFFYAGSRAVFLIFGFFVLFYFLDPRVSITTGSPGQGKYMPKGNRPRTKFNRSAKLTSFFSDFPLFIFDHSSLRPTNIGEWEAKPGNEELLEKKKKPLRGCQGFLVCPPVIALDAVNEGALALTVYRSYDHDNKCCR